MNWVFSVGGALLRAFIYVKFNIQKLGIIPCCFWSGVNVQMLTFAWIFWIVAILENLFEPPTLV
jgi:hypothetical protein